MAALGALSRLTPRPRTASQAPSAQSRVAAARDGGEPRPPGSSCHREWRSQLPRKCLDRGGDNRRPTGHRTEQKGRSSKVWTQAEEEASPRNQSPARGLNGSERSPGRCPAADGKGKSTDTQWLQVSRTFLGWAAPSKWTKRTRSSRP